jgi:hypothetical protein
MGIVMDACEVHGLKQCIICALDNDFKEIVTTPSPSLSRIGLKCRWCQELWRVPTYEDVCNVALQHYNQYKHLSFRITGARMTVRRKRIA